MTLFTANFVMARLRNILRISEFLASLGGVAVSPSGLFSSKPKASASETSSLYHGLSATLGIHHPCLQEYLDRPAQLLASKASGQSCNILGSALYLCKCRQIQIILLISAHQNIDEKWLSYTVMMHHVLNLLIFDCTGGLLMFGPLNSTIYGHNSPPVPLVDERVNYAYTTKRSLYL